MGDDLMTRADAANMALQHLVAAHDCVEIGHYHRAATHSYNASYYSRLAAEKREKERA